MKHVLGAADSDHERVCNDWLRCHKLVPDLGTVSEAAWQPEHALQTSHLSEPATHYAASVIQQAAMVTAATSAAVAIRSLF